MKARAAFLAAAVAALVAVATAANQTQKENQGFFTKLGKGLTKEIVDIKQPIEESLVYIGNSQCENVKRILGVSYEQVNDEKEPDVNLLSLEYRDPSVRVIYNITAAAARVAQNYDPSRRLIIFLHGFTDDPNKASFGNISEALLATGQYNVLALDASSLIHWLYLRCTTYVVFIGERLAGVLAALEKHGVDPSQVHLIGHSLGAHIAGFTAKTYTRLSGKRVARISALDPAGPCFTDIDPDLRLKASDAEYVDVMHTDAGVYGLKENVGHADYWPNGGSTQPGCLFQTCSHSRAWVYYAESVTAPAAFPAAACDTWEAFKEGKCHGDVSYMGYNSKPGTRGRFFLQTRSNSPHSLGDPGTRYKNTDGIVKTVGEKAKHLFG